MAKHLVSGEMEFFYNEVFSFDLLIKELSSRFNYQKVCFVGFDKEFQQRIESSKDLLFLSEFFLDLSSQEIGTDVACVVCNREAYFEDCNRLCKNLSLSLILYIDDYFNLSNLCLDEEIRLLGIVMDKNKLEKKSSAFVLNFLFNLSEIVFLVVENRINNIYFNQPLNEKIEKLSEKIEKFLNLLQKNTNFYSFDDVLEYYFEFVNILINENETVLRYISKCFHINSFDVLVLAQMILNIYVYFSENTNPNLIKYPSFSVDDYETSECFLKFNKNFDDKKFWFIYDRFNPSVQNLINQALFLIQKIRNLCDKICVDEMFNLTTKSKIFEVKDNLIDVVMRYSNESLLKVIGNYGLLNFKKNKEKSV